MAAVGLLWLFGRIELSFGRLILFMLTAATMALVEGPPDPTMMPVRSFETSASDRPESFTA